MQKSVELTCTTPGLVVVQYAVAWSERRHSLPPSLSLPFSACVPRYKNNYLHDTEIPQRRSTITNASPRIDKNNRHHRTLGAVMAGGADVVGRPVTAVDAGVTLVPVRRRAVGSRHRRAAAAVVPCVALPGWLIEPANGTVRPCGVSSRWGANVDRCRRRVNVVSEQLR